MFSADVWTNICLLQPKLTQGVQSKFDSLCLTKAREWTMQHTFFRIIYIEMEVWQISISFKNISSQCLFLFSSFLKFCFHSSNFYFHFENTDKQMFREVIKCKLGLSIRPFVMIITDYLEKHHILDISKAARGHKA